jgi:sterol desaturase/sphingolipid hydroxylase (fatty acid hydroxylase superfamily)
MAHFEFNGGYMPDPSISQMALTILIVDFLRYALAAGAVWWVVNVMLRRHLAGRRILDATPAPGQVRREITYSVSTVVIFAANGLLVWLLIANGTVEVYADVQRHGLAWWWASLALIVVAHDAWFYWTHRALHHPRWFRAVHGRHHASLHPTPWAAYAFHPVEAVVQAMFLPLFLLAVPVHTGVLGVFLLHMILRNAIGHCSHELLPWRWTPRGWLGWMTPVSHHHFHHARNRGNYGLYFTWWDRLCGTEDAQYLLHGDQRFGAAARPEAGL